MPEIVFSNGILEMVICTDDLGRKWDMYGL